MTSITNPFKKWLGKQNEAEEWQKFLLAPLEQWISGR